MFDYLITGGMLIDGTGAPGRKADLGIRDGKIAAIGNLAGSHAGQTINASGKVVTPGFWDIHRHADAAVFRPDFGQLELKQGLTTILNGNCGLSVAPCPAHREEIYRYLTPVTGELDAAMDTRTLGGYLSQAAAQPLPINVGMLVGAGTIRAAVGGYGTEHLDAGQLRQVHALLESALADGAMGVSLGLGYAPECFYTPRELMEALQPLKNSGTVITVHMRQEGSGVVDALREMLEVAKGLQTPVHISHLKSIGKANWRRCTPEMLRLLAQARQDGADVSCDVYPYTAGSTQLIHILPPECQMGGTAELSRNLLCPDFRAAIRKRMETGTDFENISLLVGWENICMSTLNLPENKKLEGKSIAEAAELRGQNPFDCAFDLLAQEQCNITMIDFIAAEEDIAAVLRDPYSCVISDSTYPTTGMLHPRVYGTYARLLEKYVQQEKILTLEQAVEKITGRPAALFQIRDRGLLRVGYAADVNVFDPAAIHERGTYQTPAQFAQGMDEVFVGGKPAIRQGSFVPAASGKVLYAKPGL